MKILCAPDSFKESMSAADAADAMARGIRRVLPDAEVVCLPMADGGEGTCSALAASLGGEIVEVACHDALGRPATGGIVHVAEKRLAVIEVASACGLERLTPAERDARITTTRGVGELIRAALDLGVVELLVGLGGSATNDAGTGMLQALGARFLDEDGRPLDDGGAALADLASVDFSGFDERLQDVRINIASDVDNPLLGERGASAVFGPQKGLSDDGVTELDGALTRWADVVEPAVGRPVRDIPGAGAAGGLGAAFLAGFDAGIEPGAEIAMHTIGFDAHLEGTHVVFTGEGSYDVQSAAGKVPAKVAERAHAMGVPTVILAGRVADGLPDVPGVIAVVPITRAPGTLEEALRQGPANLEQASATALALLTASI